MKAEDMISVLKTLNPKQEIFFAVGDPDEERDDYAKAEMVMGDILDRLEFDRAEIDLYMHDDSDDDEKAFVTIYLKNNGYKPGAIHRHAMRFYEKFGIKEEGK